MKPVNGTVRVFATCTMLTAGLLMAPLAIAEQPKALKWQELPEAPRFGKFIGEPGIPVELMTEGFLAGHPDMRWRREGLHDFSNRRYGEAMAHFLHAARYADKASQAMVAEMHWKGLGVPQDPVLGYIWMDLAAERQYPNFMILREAYWAELDEVQQRAAIARGQEVYAEFGDDVAQARLDKVLKREIRQMAGGRLHHGIKVIPLTGPLAASSVSLNGMVSKTRGVSPGGVRNIGAMTIAGERYYAKMYWDPVQYRALLDSVWKSPPTPEVEVGALRREAAEGDD